MLINSSFFLLISFLIIITYQSPLNQKDFQLELDGKKTDLYFLTNENGAEISITNYGGIIVSIMVPNKKNEYDNIVQGYSTLYEYLLAQKKGIKLNSLLGRYSNIIENDEFTLDNKNYKLTKSSYSDFGEKVWTPVQINERELRLFYTSEDGENGFPGKLHIEVIYTLTNNNELIISYTGITTKKTVINLSQRLLVNLSGNNDKKSTIKEHILELNSKLYLPCNDNKIPLGDIKSVEDTLLDFKIGKKLGEQKLDNYFILTKNNYNNDKKYGAKLEEKNSGRFMLVDTTEPGLDIFTTENNISIEPKHFPNSPNIGFFPSTILNPGDIYIQKTTYKFGIINK